jgi:hypothetical protein
VEVEGLVVVPVVVAVAAVAAAVVAAVVVVAVVVEAGGNYVNISVKNNWTYKGGRDDTSENTH